MNKGMMHNWIHTGIRKIIVIHIIFFFLLTPFLSSCGGSSDTDDTNLPSSSPDSINEQKITEAADNQNKSAQSAITGVVDMATDLQSGREMINAAFGNMTPSAENIQNFVENNPDEAADLINQLETLAVTIQSAADSYNTSINDLIAQENIIRDLLEKSNDAASTSDERDAQGLLLVGGALAILTLLGAGAAAAKGASDAMHECDSLPLCNPMPPATDSRFGECMRLRAEKLECIVYKWPKASGDAIKGTISTGVTTVASWAAGIKQWKTLKFIIDFYGAYDSADTINKGFGIKRCDISENDSVINASLVSRQNQAINPDDLTPDDIYIGTSENGTFHNVPEGNWTFLLIEDGYLRQTSGCVVATGQDPVETHVTLIPIEALTDDDLDGYSEVKGDCNDQNINIHPGASEVCSDNIDNNCDTQIDCLDSECSTDESCPTAEQPSGTPETTVNVTVSIPGHSTFASNYKSISLGSCSEDNSLPPLVFATSERPSAQAFKGDLFSLYLNNQLGTGTWNTGSGPCLTPLVTFTTDEILNENNFFPVAFASTSGSVTLQTYGTDYGESLSGNFSVQVVGHQILCPTVECEDEKEIRGSISGSFDGIISNTIQGN